MSKTAHTNDDAEGVQISALALLKMLSHANSGVPMEVMGLMLGKFVDPYTIKVVDSFSMPLSGTNVSVESVDEVFQQEFMEKLAATNRSDGVVGWYHSHPGWGCWLSNVDMNTQQNFESLHKRAVAVVVDPVQSVKGNVVIDAFRLIPQQVMMTRSEPRQTTSNLGHLQKPSLQALVHGLNRAYYSLSVGFRKGDAETKMLMKLHAPQWSSALAPQNHMRRRNDNVEAVASIAQHAERLAEWLHEETKEAKNAPRLQDKSDKKSSNKKTALATTRVGSVNPRTHLLASQDMLQHAIVDKLTNSLSALVC
ncbi:MAG: hypothetical protein MHM6MM_006050 [Cercozoa sp. M6MM]